MKKQKSQKPKLLYLPNTWEMLMNIEKDLNNLKAKYSNDYLKDKNKYKIRSKK